MNTNRKRVGFLPVEPICWFAVVDSFHPAKCKRSTRQKQLHPCPKNKQTLNSSRTPYHVYDLMKGNSKRDCDRVWFFEDWAEARVVVWKQVINQTFFVTLHLHSGCIPSCKHYYNLLAFEQALSWGGLFHGDRTKKAGERSSLALPCFPAAFVVPWLLSFALLRHRRRVHKVVYFGVIRGIQRIYNLNFLFSTLFTVKRGWAAKNALLAIFSTEINCQIKKTFQMSIKYF